MSPSKSARKKPAGGPAAEEGLAPSSMTGFGRAAATFDSDHVLCEVKTVNHRYLSLKITLPQSLMRHESWIDQRFRSSIRRGSVGVRIQWGGAQGGGRSRLNAAVADDYLRELRGFARERKLAEEISLRDLLTLPGVLVTRDSDDDVDALKSHLEEVVDAALAELLAMRQREGRRLAKAMGRESRGLAQCAQRMENRARFVPREAQKRLQDRVGALLDGTGVQVDEQLLAREVAILADRCDITEELDRLRSHLQELDTLLQSDGSVGRSLEFVIQELSREIQTIGSKSQDPLLLAQVLKAKAGLEKLREQAQNIE